MKRKNWKSLSIKMLMAVVAVSSALSGCQGTKTVPAKEKVAQLEEDKVSEKLAKYTREELIAAWGEPKYDLFGDGDLFVLNEEGSCICVYYDKDGNQVKHARLEVSGWIQNFVGTIEEDFESSAVVRVDDEGYSISSSGSLVTVDLTKGDERLDVEVGDKVYVEYIGAVMESMPLQLMDQLTISVIDNAGAFEDVDDALLAVGTLDGVTVELLEVTATSAKLGILNTTDLEIDYGEDYNLQVLEEDDWRDVPYLVENWAIPAIGYTAPKNNRVEWDVDWTVFHGELEPGHYRIVKPIMDFRGTGDYTNYHYFVEFDLPADESEEKN